MRIYIRIAAALLGLVCFTSCYENYVVDYDYNAVYFNIQADVRTVVVGEGMKFKTGVVLGGVRKNQKDRKVEYVQDQTLLTLELLDAMKAGVDYIKNAVADVEALEMMPSDYYTLSDASKMVIPKGDHKGTLEVKVDSAKFLADPKAASATYALPLKIVKADADSILVDKKTSVIAVRYENMFFGNYWRGGVTVTKNQQGTIVGEVKYYTEIPCPETRIANLTTVGPHTLLVNKVSDGDGQFYITEDGGNITVSPVEGAAKQIQPYGESKFNGAKLLQDRKIFLSYKYENGDGTTSYATDTLTFRNRIRDGVSEWQDENPAHYE